MPEPDRLRSCRAMQSLLAGYFGQDWDLDGPEWQDVLARYEREVSPAERRTAADQLFALRSEEMTEAELAEFVWRELGCSYIPRPDLGQTDLRGWLAQLEEALRRPT